MTLIHTIPAQVTREQALAHFRSGMANWFTSVTRGPVQRVADIYIPFRLFEVEVRNAERRETRLLAVDAVRGELDPYEFDSPPQLETVETRNAPPAEIGESEAGGRAVDQVRRLYFARGFFRLRSPQFSARMVLADMHIPYWVAFRGQGREAGVEVLNALRGRAEGGKVRLLVRDWLAGEDSEAGRR